MELEVLRVLVAAEVGERSRCPMLPLDIRSDEKGRISRCVYRSLPEELGEQGRVLSDRDDD
jgi:hypothetical protein